MLIDFNFKNKLDVITPPESYERWNNSTDEEWGSFLDYVVEFENDFDSYVAKDITHRVQKGVYNMSSNSIQHIVADDVSGFYFEDMMENFNTFSAFLESETWYNETFPRDGYGICDSIEQLMDKYGDVLEDNKYRWTVTFNNVYVEYSDQYRKYGKHINGDTWTTGDTIVLYHLYWHKEK